MTIYKNPVIDLTTTVGADSYFLKKRAKDPYASILLGELVDACVYSEGIRYILPLSDTSRIRFAKLPKLLVALRDGGIPIQALPFDLGAAPEIEENHFPRLLAQVANWIIENSSYVKQFLKLHFSDDIREQHKSRVGRKYIFDLESLVPLHKKPFFRAVDETDLDAEGLSYVFDLIVRFPLYGESASSFGPYQNHPIREVLKPDFISYSLPAERATVPFSLKGWAIRDAREVNLQEFVETVKRLRHVADKRGYNRANRLLTRAEKEDFLREAGVVPEFTRAVITAPTIIASGTLKLATGYYAAGALLPIIVHAGLWMYKRKLASAADSVSWLRWSTDFPFIDETKNSLDRRDKE